MNDRSGHSWSYGTSKGAFVQSQLCTHADTVSQHSKLAFKGSSTPTGHITNSTQASWFNINLCIFIPVYRTCSKFWTYTQNTNGYCGNQRHFLYTIKTSIQEQRAAVFTDCMENLHSWVSTNQPESSLFESDRSCTDTAITKQLHILFLLVLRENSAFSQLVCADLCQREWNQQLTTYFSYYRVKHTIKMKSNGTKYFRTYLLFPRCYMWGFFCPQKCF